MTSKEIINKYLTYFLDKEHSQVQNVSLIPQNDPSLLYVNSGMFPLVPYFMGEVHPLGKRLVNVQRCLRFDDLENVGNTNRHTTVFHMIGNWSLGDYFREEQLNWIYTFFIDELKLDPKKIYSSVFIGDESAPKDEDSIRIIKEIFSRYGIEAKENERIFLYGKEDNWWKRGDAVGELGGPDSEIFYYTGNEGIGLGKDPSENQDEFIEIGNSVFMQYRKTENGWEEISQKNIDFGGGLERIAMVVQKKSDIYETDNFYPIIKKLEEITGKKYKQDQETTKNMRIIADHIRASCFIAMDDVYPSNKEQGYILRRLLRRMIRAGRKIGMDNKISENLVPLVVNMFSWLYPQIAEKESDIKKTFNIEEEKFIKNISSVEKTFSKFIFGIEGINNPRDLDVQEKMSQVAFDLYQSHGLPIEIFVDMCEKEIGLVEDLQKNIEDKFHVLFSQHQEISRQGSSAKFTGGLADHSHETIKYHTATHLIHQALRKILGENIIQKGSNITGERLRFDFNYEEKLTEQQILELNDIVNNWIKERIPVNYVVLSKDEAEETGAVHAFDDKYDDQVKVYFIGNTLEESISKEYCGGPHVSNTSEIGSLEIYKQEKIGEGMLRIYAR